MNPKEILLLAVRILGLVLLYHLVIAAPTAIGLFASGDLVRIGIGLVFAVGGPAIVWWLIGGAPLLTKHAYPDEPKR